MRREWKPDEYREVDFQAIRAEEPVPVDLFLLFRLNAHVMRWKARGEVPTALQLRASFERGVRSVWVAVVDYPEWESYLRGPAEAAPPEAVPEAVEPPIEAPSEVPAAAEAAEAEKPTPRTEEGGIIAEALASDTLPKEAKRAIVSDTAKDLIQELTAAKTVEEQREANQKAWNSIQDVMDRIASETTGAVAEVWKLAAIDPDLEHAVNVATYATIFAMAFGKIENELIADLALAGLLHDVGICRVDAGLAAMPWTNFRNDQRTHYADHVDASLELISAHAPQVPERVRTIIHQHHEKFDGSGYPRKLTGFQIDDVAQLVSMADFLHGMSCGQWDGNERTLKESFETLEKLEKARTFPEYFNPDVYAIVIGWIRNSVTNEISGKASEVVLQQVRDVIDSNKAA